MKKIVTLHANNGVVLVIDYQYIKKQEEEL